MTKHNPAPPKLSLCPTHEPAFFPFLTPSTTTSQRCHPHHPETEAVRAHLHANQNHHQEEEEEEEDSAGKTRAHAQTTPSPATLTTATATMLALLAVPHHPATATVAIDHPDAMAIQKAIVPDRRDGKTVIDTEREAVTGDARPDVMEQETREKRRERKISPRRRRRSLRLLLRPVVRSL
jgi:hypothetical protein